MYNVNKKKMKKYKMLIFYVVLLSKIELNYVIMQLFYEVKLFQKRIYQHIFYIYRLIKI